MLADYNPDYNMNFHSHRNLHLIHCSIQFTLIINALCRHYRENYVGSQKHISSSSYQNTAIISGFIQGVLNLHCLIQQSALTSPATPCMLTANPTVSFFLVISLHLTNTLKHFYLKKHMSKDIKRTTEEELMRSKQQSINHAATCNTIF